MDLSGHSAFRSSVDTETEARQNSSGKPGRRMLAIAWGALSSGTAECVDIHLRSGLIVAGARDIRIDGQVAEIATSPGLWTHAFLVEEVVMVFRVPRGGRPG